MALFVLGAGATRGCSFVNEAKDPCIPPLDRDFFTQLQRVAQDKHAQLVAKVMADVVGLFGQNFDVTMESVFTTLEHTIRMLELKGDSRGFKRSDLQAKRDRLVQAIAVVLEESLVKKDDDGKTTRDPKQCTLHNRLVRDLARAGDDFITFNYDCVLDYALANHGSQKWNPRYGYGFELGARGKLLSGDESWMPDHPAEKDETIHLYKLHGSLHFRDKTPKRKLKDGAALKLKVHLKDRPYTRQAGPSKFTIIPPEWHKTYTEGLFPRLWTAAADAIYHAEHIVFIGYSLPATDMHSTALFRTSVKKGALKSLVVVNPDPIARKRTRTVMQTGLTPKTKVLSFDRLDHFLAVDRTVWAKTPLPRIKLDL